MKNEILLLFFTAHVLGDYYFQSQKLADEKAEKFSKLLLHCVVYLSSSVFFVLPIFSIELFLSALIISAAHFVIDIVKWIVSYRMQQEMPDRKKVKKKAAFKKARILYILDQAFHIASILLICFLLRDYIGNTKLIKVFDEFTPSFSYSDILRVILLFAVILKPANITFKRCFYFFKPKSNKKDKHRTGALIGDFERVLITLLLILGQYAAIGLVFTAKSIARYNKISTEKEFAEYYLLGTLYSVLVAVISYLAIWNGFYI